MMFVKLVVFMLGVSCSYCNNEVHMEQTHPESKAVVAVESGLKQIEQLDAKEEYLKRYTPYISNQWKSYDNGILLKSPPEMLNWEMSCKVIKTAHQCINAVRGFSYYQERMLSVESQNKYHYVNLAVILCQHKDVLIRHGKCIKEELLRNEKLECGLEKRWDLLRDKDNYLLYGCEESVSKCLYSSDIWGQKCGKEVANIFKEVSQKLVRLEESKTENLFLEYYIGSLGVSDHAQYAHNAIRDFLEDLRTIWPSMKTCEGFPLSKFNLRKFVRHRDGLKVLCHRAEQKVFSRLTPLLSPLKRTAEGLKSWVAATRRICNLPYHDFSDLTEQILKCTNGEDEIFNCYKGIYLSMSQAMILNGMKNPGSIEFGKVTKEVYQKASYCVDDVYRFLRSTCGKEVVDTLKDLREMLTISINGMIYTKDN